MTLDQAREYLETLGISIPDFIVEAFIKKISEKKECLESNYDENTILLIYCYLLSLIAVTQGGQFIASQSISGGVSRSFTYKDGKDLWRGQLALLKGLDKKGCVSDLIPESPYKSKNAFIMSAKGGCYRE